MGELFGRVVCAIAARGECGGLSSAVEAIYGAACRELAEGAAAGLCPIAGEIKGCILVAERRFCLGQQEQCVCILDHRPFYFGYRVYKFRKPDDGAVGGAGEGGGDTEGDRRGAVSADKAVP